MKVTARKRILAIIKKHQPTTVSEICVYLNFHPANVRHHLSILKSDRLIEEIGSRPKGGRGRPETIYSISRVFQDQGLENLVTGILCLLKGSLKEDAIDQTLRDLAHRLAENAGDIRNSPITKRLSICVVHLNKLHYQAQWEAGPSGPRIKLKNCPYWKIVEQFPDLCRMDNYLIEELSGVKLKQTSKLEEDERGLLECCFEGS